MAFYNRPQQFNNNALNNTYPKNELITARELFIIDELGEKFGVMTKEDALAKARDVGMDLILVSPNAKPPVAKIYSWSKFKYQQEKKKKDNKAKSAEQKEIWFSCFIGPGDLDHKIARLNEFLDKKHPVKITVRARGRVTYLQEKQLLDRIIAIIHDNIEEIVDRPKQEGRHLTLIVRPAKNKKVTNIETLNVDEKQNTQSDSQKV